MINIKCFHSTGVWGSFYGNQFQVRPECRAGFHCCGQVSIGLSVATGDKFFDLFQMKVISHTFHKTKIALLQDADALYYSKVVFFSR